MAGLNASAQSLRQALKDLAAAGSALGFEEMLERLEELAKHQGGLNEDTASTMGDTPMGSRPRAGLSPESLAARQEALRRALQELRNRVAHQRDRTLGDLEKVAEEMAAAARTLRQGNVDQETVDRQRRILSRLLDAQRSVREKGWSRKREARLGSAFAYRGPGTLPSDLGEDRNPLRDRMREALAEVDAAEHRRMIRIYFERLIEDAVAEGRRPASEEAP